MADISLHKALTISGKNGEKGLVQKSVLGKGANNGIL
jgi:hypothetical protein